MRYDPNDTITALSTAPGVGGIAVIRISGNASKDIVSKIFKGKDIQSWQSHSAHLGTIADELTLVDEVVVTYFQGPHSFTGEDTLEIACHGSLYIQQKIIELLLQHGARMAKEGEFTMRAFMNGKMDLSQAEAVADLIASESAGGHEMAMNQMRGGFSQEINVLREKLIHFASLIELELDFSEEDVEFADRQDLKDLVSEIQLKCRHLIDSFATGNVIKNGVAVAITGAPNMGKSTLLNQLLNEDRALVSDIPGTTRDVIEERITIEGIQFRFIDTAGIRETSDTIESMGIVKTFEKATTSAIVIYLIEAKQVLEGKLESLVEIFKKELGDAKAKVLVLINKIDAVAWKESYIQDLEVDYPILSISAKTGANLDELKSKLSSLVQLGEIQSNVIVSNVRHLEALNQANNSLGEVMTGLNNDITGDFLAIDIRKALFHLGEITGEITTDDLLGNIFSKFCIGK